MATMLLVSHGTDGDVLPFVRLGRLLAERGHEVTVLTHAPYAGVVCQAGLDFVAIDTGQEYERQLADTAGLLAGHGPRRWLEFYRRNGLFDQTLTEFRALTERHVPGDTVLVGRHTSAISVLMAASQLAAPAAWVAVSPVQLMAEIGARHLYGTTLRAGLARVAASAGLGPDWAAHQAVPELEVGLWPDWFDRAGARSPSRVRLTGFPLADDQPRPLDPAAAELLADRPVLVSGGTGRMMHPRFYEVAVEACRRADRPALLVVRHPDLVPRPLPDHVRWVPALPFHEVMPQVGVVLHHGGIGTLARALKAGTPQVILAHGVDRPDNAERLAALGLARWLPVGAWDPDAVAALLAEAESGDVLGGGRDGLRGAVAALEGLLESGVARDEVLPGQLARLPADRRAALRRLLLEARDEVLPVKVLLAQNMFWHRTHGGASKSNRIMLQDLAARGHDCQVVAPLTGELGRTTTAELLDELAEQGVVPESVSQQAIVVRTNGVLAHLALEPSGLVGLARRVANKFAPDWTLVPSDDPGLLMLGVAHQATPGRVVYLAHTLQQFPFGPRAFYPSQAGTRLVGRSAGVVAVSETAQRYLRSWGEIDATVIRPHVYGPGPYPRHQGDSVTMINPCGYKGLPIFLALADALPGTRFLAVPTWGTTTAELAELARRPNIELVPASDDVDEIWARTKIVVVPSLWDETFGYTAVEPMLRGIPVLAAATDGLREAKLGVPYLLPVRLIRKYSAVGGRPEPLLPEQDAAPWLEALTALLADPVHYAELAEQSRAAATAFVSALDPARLETYLTDLRPVVQEAPSSRPRLPADRHRLAALAQLLTKEHRP